jgi:phage terminase large subunit
MKALDKALLEQFGKPHAKQEQFYTAKERFVGYGGAKFGGKSHALRAKLTYLAVDNPGISILLVRKSLKELKENHTVKLMQAYQTFPTTDKPVYNGSDDVFKFPNGARLKLGYCDTEDDVLQYQGQEYDIVALDEAAQFSENQYGWIIACARGNTPFPKRVYLTFNPGGVGHGNIKRLFIDRNYRLAERPKDYKFIQAYAWDNKPAFEHDPDYIEAVKAIKARERLKELTPELDKEAIFETAYMRQLLSLPRDLREAWVFGNWNVFSGQFFSEWDESVHVVKPFSIPPYWRRTAALDYGFDCFAVLWFAVSPEGEVVCYRSTEDVGLAASDAAMKLLSYERGENIETHYAHRISGNGRTTPAGARHKYFRNTVSGL